MINKKMLYTQVIFWEKHRKVLRNIQGKRESLFAYVLDHSLHQFFFYTHSPPTGEVVCVCVWGVLTE